MPTKNTNVSNFRHTRRRSAVWGTSISASSRGRGLKQLARATRRGQRFDARRPNKWHTGVAVPLSKGMSIVPMNIVPKDLTIYESIFGRTDTMLTDATDIEMSVAVTGKTERDEMFPVTGQRKAAAPLTGSHGSGGGPTHSSKGKRPGKKVVKSNKKSKKGGSGLRGFAYDAMAAYPVGGGVINYNT